jgi:sporulation protein YlmC with PRC-barrel domain
MAHVGTLSDYHFKGDIDDIRGFNIYNRNGEKLGKIDDVIFNHDTGDIEYLVVDTGGWLRSRKFLVPADAVSATVEDDRYIVDLTKEQIERFPEYNEKMHEDGNWTEYESRYRKSWTEEGGVLHREGSPNILTPDPDELPPVSGDVGADVTPTRIAPISTDPAPTSDKTRLRPEGIAGRAEDTKTPGTAFTSERADWEVPDPALQREREKSGMPRSNARPVDNTLASDTGRNISDADLTEDTAEFTVDQGAHGDVRRSVAPHADAGDPTSYRQQFADVDEDLARPYPVQQGRGERWRAFEEILRNNRVDITASCHSCSPAKDKAA